MSSLFLIPSSFQLSVSKGGLFLEHIYKNIYKIYYKLLFFKKSLGDSSMKEEFKTLHLFCKPMDHATEPVFKSGCSSLTK